MKIRKKLISMLVLFALIGIVISLSSTVSAFPIAPTPMPTLPTFTTPSYTTSISQQTQIDSINRQNQMINQMNQNNYIRDVMKYEQDKKNEQYLKDIQNRNQITKPISSSSATSKSTTTVTPKWKKFDSGSFNLKKAPSGYKKKISFVSYTKNSKNVKVKFYVFKKGSNKKVLNKSLYLTKTGNKIKKYTKNSKGKKGNSKYITTKKSTKNYYKSYISSLKKKS